MQVYRKNFCKITFSEHPSCFNCNLNQFQLLFLKNLDNQNKDLTICIIRNKKIKFNQLRVNFIKISKIIGSNSRIIKPNKMNINLIKTA